MTVSVSLLEAEHLLLLAPILLFASVAVTLVSLAVGIGGDRYVCLACIICIASGASVLNYLGLVEAIVPYWVYTSCCAALGWGLNYPTAARRLLCGDPTLRSPPPARDCSRGLFRSPLLLTLWLAAAALTLTKPLTANSYSSLFSAFSRHLPLLLSFLIASFCGYQGAKQFPRRMYSCLLFFCVGTSASAIGAFFASGTFFHYGYTYLEYLPFRGWWACIASTHMLVVGSVCTLWPSFFYCKQGLYDDSCTLSLKARYIRRGSRTVVAGAAGLMSLMSLWLVWRVGSPVALPSQRACKQETFRQLVVVAELVRRGFVSNNMRETVNRQGWPLVQADLLSRAVTLLGEDVCVPIETLFRETRWRDDLQSLRYLAMAFLTAGNRAASAGECREAKKWYGAALRISHVLSVGGVVSHRLAALGVEQEAVEALLRLASSTRCSKESASILDELRRHFEYAGKWREPLNAVIARTRWLHAKEYGWYGKLHLALNDLGQFLNICGGVWQELEVLEQHRSLRRAELCNGVTKPPRAIVQD